MQDRPEWQSARVAGQNRDDPGRAAGGDEGKMTVRVEQWLGAQIDRRREDRDHRGRAQRAAEHIRDSGAGHSGCSRD